MEGAVNVRCGSHGIIRGAGQNDREERVHAREFDAERCDDLDDYGRDR